MQDILIAVAGAALAVSVLVALAFLTVIPWAIGLAHLFGGV